MAAASPSPTNTESMLQEHRSFPPPANFAADAHVSSMERYEALHPRSLDDPDGFWAEVAADLHWFQKWDRVLRMGRPRPGVVRRGEDEPVLQLPRPPGRRGPR